MWTSENLPVMYYPGCLDGSSIPQHTHARVLLTSVHRGGPAAAEVISRTHEGQNCKFTAHTDHMLGLHCDPHAVPGAPSTIYIMNFQEGSEGGAKESLDADLGIRFSCFYFSTEVKGWAWVKWKSLFRQTWKYSAGSQIFQTFSLQETKKVLFTKWCHILTNQVVNKQISSTRRFAVELAMSFRVQTRYLFF